MKKKNKKIIILSIFTFIIIAGFITFGVIFSKDKNALTLNENKWIDQNKQNVIDIAIMNDIPILSFDGKGLIYDYLDYVTDQYSLKFNVIPYKLDNSVDYEYKINIVDKVSNNDIVLLKDDYVFISLDNTEYTDISKITNLKLGVLSADKDIINNYFVNNNIELVEYKTYLELKNGFIEAQTKLNVNGIIIPKILYTKEIIENDYKIAYDIVDLNKYFVLETKGNKDLNSILSKSFNLWKEKNYLNSYNLNLLNSYYTFKNISDINQKKLQSKTYSYGFINYGIYNSLDNKKINGLNKLVLKDFNSFSNLSIKFTKYNSIAKLLSDFNSKKIDFMLNIVDNTQLNSDVIKTSGAFDKRLAIVSGINNKNTIDSIYSLKGKEVLIVKDSDLEKTLIDSGIKIKAYNSLSDLVTDFKSDSVTLIDLENYNYYKSSKLKDCKINKVLEFNDKYNYLINNTQDNTVFKDIFDFYVNYTSTNKLIQENYDKIAYENVNIVYLLIAIIIILVIYVVIDFTNHFKVMIKKYKKSKKIKLSKEDKIKYIDQLTSLKNRAYLNSRIESWDSSEVYPQSIIIIDLNNISYINDNYGREEGDKVITEAANILIQNQLHNSEIIRTDGNEFLIYLVGYSEKQIIAYLRKLNKELKGLSHGFGAASGYSIILDAIKTVDDAVNEATIDMKNNKEDIEY